MSVSIDIQRVGTFNKNADKTIVINGLPPRLNESSHLYGPLIEELDLTLGCEEYADSGYDDRMNTTFKCIRQITREGSAMKQAIDADFVSNRRNLQVLAQSPYYLQPMEIQAIRQNGVIFLCDKQICEPDGTPPHGYKFEQYMTLREDGSPHSKFDKVSNVAASKAMLRASIKSGGDEIKVLYAAEIDAIDSKGNFVEMKSTSMCYTKWLEKASLGHYLQSYLAGVPYIIYGRKVSWSVPIVYRTDKRWTERIPKDDVTWKKDVCFKQLFTVLHKVQSKLEYDEEALVIQVTKEGISFEPECSENCTFMDPSFLNHFSS